MCLLLLHVSIWIAKCIWMNCKMNLYELQPWVQIQPVWCLTINQTPPAPHFHAMPQGTVLISIIVIPAIVLATVSSLSSSSSSSSSSLSLSLTNYHFHIQGGGEVWEAAYGVDKKNGKRNFGITFIAINIDISDIFECLEFGMLSF